MGKPRAVLIFSPDTVVESRLTQELETLVEQGYIIAAMIPYHDSISVLKKDALRCRFEVVEETQVQLSRQQAQQVCGHERVAEVYSTSPVSIVVVQRDDVYQELKDISLDNAVSSVDEYTTRNMLNVIFPKRKRPD